MAAVVLSMATVVQAMATVVEGHGDRSLAMPTVRAQRRP
jgi:hypothetical protein